MRTRTKLDWEARYRVNTSLHMTYVGRDQVKLSTPTGDITVRLVLIETLGRFGDGATARSVYATCAKSEIDEQDFAAGILVWLRHGVLRPVSDQTAAAPRRFRVAIEPLPASSVAVATTPSARKRILLSTYSAASLSSYGLVVKEIFTRIAAARPDLEIVQHGWCHPSPAPDVPWLIFPTMEGEPDQYGGASFAAVARLFAPDLVFSLGDPRMVAPAVVDGKKQLGYKLLYYCPVDSAPVHDQGLIARIADADRIVAMAPFGRDALHQHPLLKDREIDCILHGVDTRVFRRLSDADRSSCRQRLLGERARAGTFVLGWVGRNQERKQVWQLYALMMYLTRGWYLRCRACRRVTPFDYDEAARKPRQAGAFQTFRAGYDLTSCYHCGGAADQAQPMPDIVLLAHLHYSPDGYDLKHLAATYGVADSIVYAPLDTSADEMNALYNSFDAFVYPTGGEGFGLPLLEAMATGAPAVYSNYSGHAGFGVGLPVAVRLMPLPHGESFWAQCDMANLLEQVLKLHESQALRQTLGQEGLRRAEDLDWDRLTPSWLRVIDDLLAR